MTCCCGYYQIVEKLNLVGRTSEMARLYGTEFFNALARGSQVCYMCTMYRHDASVL